MMRRALVGIVALAASASAAPTPESTQANEEGQRLFHAGRYLESVAPFERAYAIDPDPAYLFDIAQAYRLAHVCDKAVEYYDRFLHEVPDPPNADKIRGFRDASVACAEAQKPRPEPVPLEPVPVPVVAPPPPEHERGEPSPERGHQLETAGLITIAGGAVAAGLGIYFSTHAASLQHERDALCNHCTWTAALQQRADDLDASGHRAVTLSIVSYSVAGAALAGGAALYLIGRSRGTTVAAIPQPGGALIFAGATF